jgi:hypothetical protein
LSEFINRRNPARLAHSAPLLPSSTTILVGHGPALASRILTRMVDLARDAFSDRR